MLCYLQKSRKLAYHILMHSPVEVWGWSYCRICTRISSLHCVDHLSYLRLKHNLLLWWTWGFWANLSSGASDLTVYAELKHLISFHFTTKQITSTVGYTLYLLLIFWYFFVKHLFGISNPYYRGLHQSGNLRRVQSTSKYQYLAGQFHRFRPISN